MISLREQLKTGKTLFSMAYSWPDAGIIEATAHNFDVCWIDAQHGPWDLQQVASAIRACDIVGKPALARVADHAYGRIGQTLDLAPAGIILPCVDTPEQARAVVQSTCFPPIGNRSFGGRRVIDLHTRAYVEDPALHPVVIAQIETPLGLENVEAIAAIEGIDMLFFGPDDMNLRLGRSLALPIRSPEVAPQARRVAEACRQQGKYAMTVSGCREDIECMLEAGFNILNVAGDAGILRKGAAETAKMLTEIRKNIPANYLL